MSNEEFVTGIGYPKPFDEYAVDLCRNAVRYACIMSPQLDHQVFDNAELAGVLSALARDTRQTRVRILINDSRAVVAKGHRLLQLARRLPSTVQIQKLTEHPDWTGQTVVIRDLDGVLYKPDDSDNNAFYEPRSRASTRRHLELFEELWRFSEEDPNLRTLRI